MTIKERFARDGIVFPIRVLSAEEAAKYAAECETLEARMGGKPKTIEVRQMHLHFPWAFELATRPTILDAVEELLGPNVLIWATELFAKHARDPNVSIGWHRDRPYMGFDVKTSVTAWVALRDSTPANGCMRAMPGPSRFEGNQSKRIEVIESQTVDVVLQAGEMSMHDMEVPHGSGPNLSGDKRIGFVIRYVMPEANPGDGRPPAIVARGRDNYGHFQLVDPPTDRDAEQALAAMKESASSHFEAMLQSLKRTQSR